MRLLLVLTLLLQACASAGQSWRAGPAGIPAERQIRAQLVAGQYGTALESIKQKEIAPADALLRHLYKGLIAVHAGQNELGSRALDRAWEISYQRYTRRLSDGAQSMVTGEGALPYNVGPTERLMIPYYGGLNWLARNERDETAVEARRMGVLLASDASNNPDSAFMGAMRYISGVMFEVAGERADADVAYRNAAALLGRLPGDTIPPDSAHGDVVVLIEDGFVARPEPTALDFWVAQDEVAMLESADGAVRLDTYRRIDGRRGIQRDWRAERYRNVSLRWPVMGPVNPEATVGRLGARATGLPRQWDAAFGSGPVIADAITLDVSRAVRADFEREQPGRIARALARAAVREVTANAAEGAFSAAGDVLTDEDDESKSGKGEKGSKKDDKKSEGGNAGLAAAGLILAGIGMLALHVSSQVLDQPDLRAWQVLPDRVVVSRMRLPAGEHLVEVTRDGEAYSLGTVTVRPGTVTVLVHRWWPGVPPAVAEAPVP
ncbi:MAG: hypothetical protein IPJ78_08555 [Gemmatimonadetes bacterium]|jgi:hypothetical protein|nr:hypothetical protein [Gemmatimonadota bacterium]MBP7549496.1 hypothetical protein [Gemmatimonadaceae bacterium]